MAEYHNENVVQCIRKDVALASLTSGTQYKIGNVPKGAVVIGTTVGITTVFNAGTTNVLIVGTSGDDDALVAAADVNEAAVAVTRVAPATLAGAIAASADTDVYVKYTQTGTAATTGAGWVVVEYVLDPTKYV